MANIQNELNNIKNALFGQEVRCSIHDGIDAINKEVESTTSRQVDLESTFDQLVINAGNSNAEIVDARVKADGTSYTKLGDRLDAVDSQLEHKMNESDIDKIVKKIKNATYNNPINIKLIGDSITHGMGGTGYSQAGKIIWGNFRVNTDGYCWANVFKKYLETNYHCNVKNYGTSGVKTQEVLANIHSLINDCDDIVILMIGTNNKLDNELNTFKTELNQIIEIIQNKGKDCIVMCSIPTTKANDLKTPYSMKEIDNAIDEVVSNMGKSYISLYKKWVEYCEANSISSNFLFVDEVHPNDKGHFIMINIILGALGIYSNIDFSYINYWKTDKKLSVNDIYSKSCNPFINNDNQLFSTNFVKKFPLMLLGEHIKTIEFDVDVDANVHTWVVLGGDFSKSLILAINGNQAGLIFLLPNESDNATEVQGYDYNKPVTKVKIERLDNMYKITYNNSDIMEYLFNNEIFDNIENKRLGFMVQSDSPNGKSYKNISIKN